jgi:hypothetical protein
LEEFGVSEIDTLCQFYGKERAVEWCDENGNHKNTSEPVISGEETKAEWTCLKRVVIAEHFPRDCFWKLWNLIATHHKEQFPNLIVLAQLALTSAVHTAGCERGFSMQNQILTKLRNRLTVDTQGKLMSVKMCPLDRKTLVEKALGVWKSEKKNRKIYTLKEKSNSKLIP